MGALGNQPRGRRPRFLHFNTQRAGILGIDIHPADTTLAVADLSTRFLMLESMPTERDPKVFIKSLCQHLVKALRQWKHLLFEGIGVTLPGRIELKGKRLVHVPSLGWEGLDLKHPLEQATVVCRNGKRCERLCPCKGMAQAGLCKASKCGCYCNIG